MTFAGKASSSAGKQGLFKTTDVFAADLMSYTEKLEISIDDGKTWIPYSESKCTKVKPARKK